MSIAPLAYILQNQVAHIRLLPRPSKHSFVYPTLSVLVSLSALERKQLDLWRGWLFGYGSSWGRVTGLCASGYLYNDPSDKRSIRAKVVDVLEQHGYTGGELDDAWLMTMPSFLGFEGINPLSVYFCYRREKDALWLVILEVHNTFGERHVYVLDTSKREASLSTRFDYQWTFPRQFHVSPFNDRSGHYVCHLTAPSHPPSIPQDPPRPLIKLTLLTSPPRLQRKLIATLRTIHASPLSSTALLSALIHTPFLLLFTFPRILYQAYLLHYHKSLDVYQRPEPCASDPSIEAQLPAVRNAIQPDETGYSVGRHGGVGWQHLGFLERWCQRRVYTYLQKQCSETNISVTLIPANPSEKCTTINPVHHPRSRDVNVQHIRTLQIYYRSPRIFTLLFTSPSPMHTLQLGVHADNIFSVSSEYLFTALFAAPSEVSDTPRWRWLGLRLARHLRSLSVPDSIDLPIPTLQALDSYDSSPGTIIIIISVLLTLLLLAIVERAIFSSVGARFVVGDEPWGGWGRVKGQGVKGASADVSARPGEGLGSVRRMNIEEGAKERKRLKRGAREIRICTTSKNKCIGTMVSV